MPVLAAVLVLVLTQAPPAAPPPYRVTPLTVTNGDVSLAGTLTMPQPSSGPMPAVVLITGSGPQTRDEDVFGFKAAPPAMQAAIDDRAAYVNLTRWILAAGR